MRTCAACGSPAQGNTSIHRDGFGEGPDVDLCDDCGLHPLPTCEDIWMAIARRRVTSIDQARRDREKGGGK